MARHSNSLLNELVEYAHELGYQTKKTNNGHVKCFHPNNSPMVLIAVGNNNSSIVDMIKGRLRRHAK